jgi:hypothetical protein
VKGSSSLLAWQVLKEERVLLHVLEELTRHEANLLPVRVCSLLVDPQDSLKSLQKWQWAYEAEVEVKGQHDLVLQLDQALFRSFRLL